MPASGQGGGGITDEEMQREKRKSARQSRLSQIKVAKAELAGGGSPTPSPTRPTGRMSSKMSAAQVVFDSADEDSDMSDGGRESSGNQGQVKERTTTSVPKQGSTTKEVPLAPARLTSAPSMHDEKARIKAENAKMAQQNAVDARVQGEKQKMKSMGEDKEAAPPSTSLSRGVSGASSVAVEYVLDDEEDDLETRIQRKTEHMFQDEEKKKTGDDSAAPPELRRNENRNNPSNNPGAVRIVSTESGGRRQGFNDSFSNHDLAQGDQESLGARHEGGAVETFQGGNSGNYGGGANVGEGDPEIAAELIDDEVERKRLKDTLAGVLESQSAVQVVNLEEEDRLKRERQSRNMCIYGGLGIVLTIIIIVAVVTSAKNNKVTQAPTEAPTMMPTQAPTSKLSAVMEAVENGFGPVDMSLPTAQARAVEWLTSEDNTFSYPFDSEDAEYEFYDRYVSLVLAFSTNYQNWTDNTNWLDPDLSVCDWHGLTCNDDGRIGVLDLAVHNLYGTLPTEIGFLDNLDFVFLFRNELTGTIPTEVGMLGDVDFMYLNENKFTGSISEELAGLLDADDLFLFGNQLTGTIPASFGGLVDLVNLYLHDNQLSGSIPSSLSSLKRVQRLQLQNNRLSGEIPSELGSIITLQRLQLQNNVLTGTVPSTLGSFLGLTVLTTQGNNLTGEMPNEVCLLRDESRIDNLEILEADCLNETVCDCCSACF